jgi:hypothetical protein
VPPASGLESRVVQLLRSVGIELRPQIDSGGEHWTGRVQLRHPVLPLIVEVQSERHHAALVDRDADDRRLTALRRQGFVVVTLWDVDVWARPRAVISDVERGIRLARASVRPMTTDV